MFRWRKSKITDHSPSTDLVGYEVLIDFICQNRILSVEGDLVEIGVFLGGGTYKLSRFLKQNKSKKKLYTIDKTHLIRIPMKQEIYPGLG